MRDVRESIALIEKRGGRAIYLACDANDQEKVKAAIRTAKEQHGLTLTGIMHAAGVVKDKMVENKTAEDFDSVFGIKVTGLTNVLSAFTAEERASLRHLVVFSSLAGFHGNAGQTDYAMANDALSKMAHRFGAAHRGCSVRALCFGPWDGGMVRGATQSNLPCLHRVPSASPLPQSPSDPFVEAQHTAQVTPALKAHFKSQGVQIIPRCEGAEQVAALLTMRSRDRSQVLVGNWGMPAVAPDEAEQQAPPARPLLPKKSPQSAPSPHPMPTPVPTPTPSCGLPR